MARRSLLYITGLVGALGAGPDHCTAQIAPATYLVFFTDKSGSPYTVDQPESFLSARAIARRERQGIPIDALDIPVNPAYVDGLLQAGVFQLMGVSKWFNAATIRTTDTLALDTLHQLPFVLGLRCVHDGRARSKRASDKFPSENGVMGGHYEGMYGASLRQIAMMNGHLLHQYGAKGQGRLIGVLDSGFDQVDVLPAFAPLRQRGGIVAAADMVTGDGDVYADHWHGRSVLAVMAAQLPGTLIGTAPDADYVLIRSEDAATEYVVEEDHWVRGAEWADSLGCDLLNTSLGYSLFDDSLQDHSYADMDGLTTRISIAAGIAAGKGMIPVTSAGNSGSSPWFHITAPADARDILAVGAVDADRSVAPWSSRGPSADGRLKPDVSAMGLGTLGLGGDGTSPQRINGTSFSAPLVTGLVACLWQLHPERSAQEIMAAVRASAFHPLAPGPEVGHGVPDLWRAHLLLGGRDLLGLSAEAILNVMPNPFEDLLEVELYTGAAERLRLRIFDPAGRPVWSASAAVEQRTYQRIRLTDGALVALPAGVYVVEAELGMERVRRTLVKYAR